MKKVMFKIYFRQNLGDDLFAYIFLKRYKNNFYVCTEKSYLPLNTFNNIKFRTNHFKIFINKIIRKIFRIEEYLDIVEKKKYDILLYVGGSLFIQNQRQNLNFWKKNAQKYSKNYIPYYILGSNIGPYKNDEFVNILKRNIFLKAEDVCFRDKNSYDLCKNLPNIRMASDIVFSLDIGKVKITNNKKVVISVMEVREEYREEYKGKIIDFIKFFFKRGYKITLMSYCKAEGDEIAIKSILDKLDMENIKEEIRVYFYRGNIEEALNIMGDCRVIIGTRFHANILGLLMNKTIIPIAYSDKTINVLNDINFKGKIFDVRNFDNVQELTDDDLEYKLDISYQILDAERQFQELDKVLEKSN